MKYDWARWNKSNFECSSKGDKRFSAFYAILKDGKSIEYHYQVKIKGYRKIEEGKGKPPKNNTDKKTLWKKYKKLWKEYFALHPELLKEISILAKDKVITDCFATSEINQARAICEILNEKYK